MIRYTRIGDINWYSLNDIKAFLVKGKVISKDKQLHARLLNLIAKKFYLGSSPIDDNLWIGLKPSDLFISSTSALMIREVCNEKENIMISRTHLLAAIDYPYNVKKDYPEIHKILKLVKLTDVIVGNEAKVIEEEENHIQIVQK